jgi:HAD superfamily hydrolase (TIGR01509 family)
MMIESVVFDLGGVVIGRDYDRYGPEIAEFSFLQGDRPFPDWWKRYDLGTASRSEVVEAVCAESGLAPDRASAKLDRLMELFNEFDDTVELIRELSAKGYGLYVLSNMPAEFYDYVSRFDVFRYFDGQIVSSREGLAKPDPRMFALLTERYGLRPETTLFVDDKPSNTTAAARLGFAVHTFVPGCGSCDRIRELVAGERR